MGIAIKKAIRTEFHQWFKNGDHPDDHVGEQEVDWVALGDLHPELFGQEPITDGKLPADTPTYTRQEGAVVRYFRAPDISGTEIHAGCGHTWHDHGWIDTLEGGHNVCPSDYIMTGIDGEHWPVKSDIFDRTYDVIEP